MQKGGEKPSEEESPPPWLLGHPRATERTRAGPDPMPGVGLALLCQQLVAVGGTWGDSLWQGSSPLLSGSPLKTGRPGPLPATRHSSVGWCGPHITLTPSSR